MKRGIIILVFLIIIAGFFLIYGTKNIDKAITGYVISDAGVMVEKEVIERVEDNEEVRVNIKVEDTEKIEESLGDNIKHTFEDRVSAIISEEELLELQDNPDVKSIELVGMRSISLQDSVPLINSSIKLWNLQIDGVNLTGAGETICIIDTGVNYSHSSLGGCYGDNDEDSSCKVLGGWDYCADDTTCTTSDNDPMDNHWHGTHVSGIAAANGNIKGVAPGAKIIMIKASNSTGTFWDDDLEKAIDWCVDNASTFNISVISMSLGGGLYSSYCNDDPLNDSINNAVANGISVVVASGNDGSTTQISGPACHENAIPVGGTDKSGAMYSNGNRNSLVLLLAPGVSINSTYINGGYASSSGTSMSTPHVAGAFAIINQYRRLEGLSEMTPTEIENALNDSGKVISDGGSGLDFSRIQIYQTIINMDESEPSVTLNSPSNNFISANENQTFACTATDIQLKNLTFYLWNSSNDNINETSFNSSGNSLQIEVNQTLSNNGTYTWNCLGYDTNSNSDWASGNYTLKIGGMLVILNSPTNSSHTSTSSVDFNCTSQDTTASLVNVTLYVWNSSKVLKYNTTSSISGTTNTTNFTYTLSSEGAYEWNCMAYDEDSNSFSGTFNYTITYDTTNPVVNLVSPADEATETEGDITFKYNVTDANNIANCSLIVDNDITETDASVTKNTNQTIEVELNAGNYDWKIRCFDSAGKSDDSEEREITVEEEAGISEEEEEEEEEEDEDTIATTTPATTFLIPDANFTTGISKIMKEGDKMKFDNNSHTLELLDITSTKIKVKISSDPITLDIKLEGTEKTDLDSDNRYDLSVTYVGTTGSLAEVRIQSIDEAIPTRQIAGNGSNESIKTNGAGTGHSIKELIKNMSTTAWIILGIVAGAMILAGVGYFLYKKNNNILGPIFKKKYEKLLKK